MYLYYADRVKYLAISGPRRSMVVAPGSVGNPRQQRPSSAEESNRVLDMYGVDLHGTDGDTAMGKRWA